MRVIRDPPIRATNQVTPSPRRVTRQERIGSDLIHVVASRKLALNNPSSTLYSVSVVNSFASMADSIRRALRSVTTEGQQLGLPRSSTDSRVPEDRAVRAEERQAVHGIQFRVGQLPRHRCRLHVSEGAQTSAWSVLRSGFPLETICGSA
jgi:hypothetical protein